MIQRKVPIKDVESDERLANLTLSSSQYQDGKGRGADRMNKMKKSRSIKLSDLDALQSPPSRRSLSQPGKEPLISSPNYMKPTSSSDAKKKHFLANLQNAESGSESKNLLQNCSSDSKSSIFSSRKPAKSLSRSSSLNLVRTSTKTPTFETCKSCPRGILFEDVKAPERATCSSTLKDAKFPAYLMLDPEGTESDGASAMKVCPYTYCSLNGHPQNGCPHTPLLPLKSFMSARKRLLKTKKNIQLEDQGHSRLMVPCETKDSQIEHIGFDGKSTWDETDKGNPIITSMVEETGMDLFIEIYAKEKEGPDKMGRFNSAEDLEDHQEDFKFETEQNGIATKEDTVKQVTPDLMIHDLPKSEIGFEENFKIYFDDDAATEADTKASFHQEQRAEDADGNRPPSWFQEEICTGNHCDEVICDGEHLENIELDDSDSQKTDVDYQEWEEEKICAFNLQEEIDSPIVTKDTNSKFESSSESSHDISEMWIDDTLSCHYAHIPVEKTSQEAKGEKNTGFETQPHGTHSVLEGTSESIELENQETDYLSSGTSYESGQSSLTEEVFQHLPNAEDNKENEKHEGDKANCVSMVLDEETVENSEGQKTSSDIRRVDESHKNSKTSLQNNVVISQQNKIHSLDVPEESANIVQDQEVMEKDQVKASKLAKNRKWETWHKRPMQDDDEMRKIKPRKLNFLPLVPDPEPEKVDLKHQMIDERKNADEWMLDFALRQTVTKLAPAGKRKVALLVEAFETVMSIPKCETHMRKDSPFSHARPIQACS